MEKHQKQDLFTTLTQIIMQQRLENLVELLKFCEKYQDELDLPNLEVIIGVIGMNVGLIELYFDGMIRSNNCNGTKPNMVLVVEEKLSNQNQKGKLS